MASAKPEVPISPYICFRRPPITYSYRNIGAMDLDRFRADLRSSALYTTPAESADSFADQFDVIVAELLNRHAPLVRRTKVPGKNADRWLSPEARSSIRERRRFERRWKSTGSEKDRKEYRIACRRTNVLIIESRRLHSVRRLQEAGTDARKRWSVVKDVLHTANQSEIHSASESASVRRV